MQRRSFPLSLGTALALAVLASPAAMGHGGAHMDPDDQDRGPAMMGGYPGQDMGPGMMGGYPGQGTGPGMMGGYPGQGMGPGMRGGYPGQGMGPGMMGGYPGQGMGPGMMGGYPGQGMGPGMMGGYPGQGMGPGMMGGYPGQGMGPGMMGGYPGQGMGPGMMGGYPGQGMGPGMMGGYHGQGMGPGFWTLLTPEQHQQARQLMTEHQAAQYERRGEMMRLRQSLMAELHAEDAPDADALAETQARLAELQRQIWLEHRALHDALLGLLDEEQRQRLTPGDQASPE
ncbi:Spy/CpxP family protein refolding chaperone [Halomonas sp. M4R1S46]|uniref:Spy/CpxP family protein refolding chaperone n=1 Tax=Halomonas sp. M4R1S46 TaxID=2982692 RepID=UPI0021E45A7B|nr:hypothetical protein [Halomonas sp. M4R1S46]UYG09050.1 hypothetical protein OCT48_06890 [Halomonas sp. M4R1S46]